MRYATHTYMHTHGERERASFRQWERERGIFLSDDHMWSNQVLKCLPCVVNNSCSRCVLSCLVLSHCLAWVNTGWVPVRPAVSVLQWRHSDPPCSPGMLLYGPTLTNCPPAHCSGCYYHDNLWFADTSSTMLGEISEELEIETSKFAGPLQYIYRQK